MKRNTACLLAILSIFGIVAVVVILIYHSKDNFVRSLSNPMIRTDQCIYSDPSCQGKCGSSDDWKSIWYDPTIQTNMTLFFKWYNPTSSQWEQSALYKLNEFNTVLDDIMDGIGDYHLYHGKTTAILVNIAAFLSQCMAETIEYNACDENNWSKTENYPLTASCGQGGQDYTGPSYSCDGQCPIDPKMKIVASTNATWYGAPGPLFCAPKTQPSLGHWDTQNPNYCPKSQDPIFDRPDEYINQISTNTQSCQYYSGQKGGSPAAISTPTERTSVEGCCWWGRGIIQLTGPCNMGKLNTYLKGTKYLPDGKNLCQDPSLICSPDAPLLKYVAGFIYWCSEVQTYSDKTYNYITDLEAFATRLEADPSSTIDNMQWQPDEFIYSVSGIVNRGCPTPGSGCDPWAQPEDRRMCFFQILLRVLYLGIPPDFRPCSHP